MAKILAYRLSKGIISSECGQSTLAPTDIFHWLALSHTAKCATILGTFWDLSALYSALPLPDSVRAQLSSPPHRAKFGNYRLFYIPDKVFSVNLNGSEVSFYDLSQYFPGEPEPSSLAQLQEHADLLQAVLTELGADNPTTLSSPVAAFKGHKTLEGLQDTIPTIFDAPEPVLDAYELALQCTPREWVSNYRVGVWDNE